MKSINDLDINEEAVIVMVGAKDNIKKRLLDIGFVKGSLVKPILVSPGDDMVAYQVKGAVIAIRKDDTKDIMVEALS